MSNINVVSGITLELLNHMTLIEARAYPLRYRAFEDMTSIEDAYIYLESTDIVVMYGDNWYMILSFNGNSCEIADFAVDGEMKNIIRVMATLFDIVKTRGVNEVTTDMREATSYRIKRLFSRYGWKIVHDEPWDWEGEIFHNVKAIKGGSYD